MPIFITKIVTLWRKLFYVNIPETEEILRVSAGSCYRKGNCGAFACHSPTEGDGRLQGTLCRPSDWRQTNKVPDIFFTCGNNLNFLESRGADTFPGACQDKSLPTEELFSHLIEQIY